MKKTIRIFLLIVVIFNFKLESQINFAKLDFNLYRLQDSNLLTNRLDSLVAIKNYFVNINEMIDSLYYKDATQLIMNYDSIIEITCNKWFINLPAEELDFMPSTVSINFNRLKVSQNYLNLSDTILFDSIIKNWENYLLQKEISNMSFSYLQSKFSTYTSCEELSRISSLLFSPFSPDLCFNILKTKRQFIRNCSEIYSVFVFQLMLSNYSLKDQFVEEELLYINNDLNSNPELKDKLLSMINKTYVDPNVQFFLNRDRRTEDSLDIISEAKRFERKRIRDSIYNISKVQKYEEMNEEQKRRYRIFNDTTLRTEIGSFPGYEKGDYGMRFDTFPNEILIHILDTIDFHKVYDSLYSDYMLNESNSVNILRKIFQLLGDRNAYGLFSPDSSQQEIINRWIDDYKYMACQDSIQFKSTEANYQLIKLWRLLYPTFKDWLINYSMCLELGSYTGRFLNTMATEPMVLQLINEADQYYISGESSKLYAIAFFLKEIRDYIDLTEYQRLPRRPARNAVESQRWVDDYIYPALKRWKIPGIE